MLQQALSTAFSMGVNFIVSNQAFVQFNPAVTVAITMLQAVITESIGSTFFQSYFLVCFFGPLIGGLAAGLAVPVKEEPEKPVKFQDFVKKLREKRDQSRSTDDESTEDEEDMRPLSACDRQFRSDDEA